MISYHKEMFANERIRELIEEAAAERLARRATAGAPDGRSRRSTLTIAGAFVRRLGRVAHAS